MRDFEADVKALRDFAQVNMVCPACNKSHSFSPIGISYDIEEQKMEYESYCQYSPYAKVEITITTYPRLQKQRERREKQLRRTRYKRR